MVSNTKQTAAMTTEEVIKYEGLKNYLNNQLEIEVADHELEEIIHYAIKTYDWQKNVGYKHERIHHNDREKAFHDQWLKENLPLSWLNNGNGILQDLFIERGENPFAPDKWVEIITERDRYIVATIIQWLGSNVGMCFLSEALKRFGARIVYDETYKSSQP